MISDPHSAERVKHKTPCRLTFIIPLRPREQTTNWPMVSDLCLATIRSCLKHPSSGIFLLLVGHEKPQGFDSIDDSRKKFIRATSDLPAAFEGRGGMKDKWAKLYQGLAEVAKDPPDYFMFVDADDLVSPRLYDFLDKARPQNGAVCKDGYSYRLGAKYVHLVRDNFNCGTNAVVATQSIQMPCPASPDRREQRASLRLGHTIVESEMAKNGTPLVRVPFPAVIHVQHPEQHSKAFQGKKKKSVPARARAQVRSLVSAMRAYPKLHRSSRILPEFEG